MGQYGTGVWDKMEQVYGTRWNMCMGQGGTGVWDKVEHVYGTRWNMCMGQDGTGVWEGAELEKVYLLPVRDLHFQVELDVLPLLDAGDYLAYKTK